MTTAHPTTDLSLTLKRQFAAPPAAVFRLWTDPGMMKRWFSPEGLTTVHAEVDLRVGGSYRIGMRNPEGSVYTVTGIYQAVEPGQRLVFTWVWSETLLEARADDMLVTVTFAPQDGGTEMTLLHQRLPDESARMQHESGWNGCFDKLAQIV